MRAEPSRSPSPHTQTSFVLGVLIYNGIAGIAYAAFTALGLQLVGHHSPVASTQLGLFAAATNGAIVFMTGGGGDGEDTATAFVTASPSQYAAVGSLRRGGDQWRDLFL